eukprot:CAMPEP_0184309226 /NCGR_PEP_ID=MMETSP1049-20130417/17454_1 /TAXON_ID=77928 /ORGANISM="Proteomonas sulcata, Strain CCMP704" /LENGTH=193 /DNA_ID=CAMNT_0026622077 /DNA_START=100 /DNA_END=678 /DNA_ORIENTATION=+
MIESALSPLALLIVLGLLGGAEGGYCVSPPAGALAFCAFIRYQVYVVQENIADDYWFRLDRDAEILNDQWAANENCDSRIDAANGWCKNYACALMLPKCNSFGDAPLGVCRQTCVDCLETCDPDRPVLPPSIYFEGDSPIWADHYKKTEYDAWTKAYRCEANHKLLDGFQQGMIYYGPDCTSPAAPRSESQVW